MIKNERQLRVASKKLEGLEAARSDAIDKAGWRAYTDLIDDVSADIAEYEDIRDRRVRRFEVGSLDAIGEAVIKARISKGWTQKQLAEELGVSEQQVQKDESRDFENAGLSRVAEILDVLGYELVGTVRPRGESSAGQVEDGASLSTTLPATVADFHWPTDAAATEWTSGPFVMQFSEPMNAAMTERVHKWLHASFGHDHQSEVTKEETSSK